MTITPYCSKDEFAQGWGYATLVAFRAAGKNWPTDYMLDRNLEGATVIMNDNQHFGGVIEEADVDETDWVRIRNLCFNMSNRMMGTLNVLGQGGRGIQQWSQADYMMSFERTFCFDIGTTTGNRILGGNV